MSRMPTRRTVLQASLAGSLVIGQAETFGKAWLPDSRMLTIYVVMASVVLRVPQRLFQGPRAAGPKLQR